jgi:hypothetical protein
MVRDDARPDAPFNTSARSTGSVERPARTLSSLAVGRVLVSLGARTYAGLELGSGPAFERPDAGSPRTSEIYYEAVTGFVEPLGPFFIGAELGVGGRSSYQDPAVVTTTDAVIDPRARAGVWLSPWLSLDATAGADVLDAGAWSCGVYLAMHSYSYGGLR